MPYTRCPGCGTLTYSAAKWSHVESCPACDAPLARSPAPLRLVPPPPGPGLAGGAGMPQGDAAA